MRTPVEAILHEDVVPSRKNRQKRSRDRRHTAGRNQGRIRVLRCCELFMQRVVVWRVVQADIFQTVIVVSSGILKSSRLKNGKAYSPLNPRVRFAGLNQ